MVVRTHEEKVAWLADRAEICDLVGIYSYAMDARDWTRYRTIWADRVEVDLSEAGLASTAGLELDADAWVAAIAAFFEEMTASNHVKIPISFEFDGDRCTVLCLMRGKHFMSTDTGTPFHEVVGYYRDEFVRTDQGWRLKSVRELVGWNEGNAFVLHDNLGRFLPLLQSAAAGTSP
jgi:hypothetical protein